MSGNIQVRKLGNREVARQGFTLVEVLLAVALSTILMAAIGAVIFQNTRVLYNQQITIERSQIARSVLAMVKSDLRAAMQYKPSDVSALDELNVSQASILAGAAGIDPSALSGLAGAGGGGDTDAIAAAAASGLPNGGNLGGQGGEAESPDAAANQDIASTGQSASRPGLFGNSTEIMIDVSRLPRVDQYDPIVNQSEGEVSLPTDVKTVAYFLSDRSEEAFKMQVGTDSSESKGGLYRRELDRAVASYSSDIAGTLARLGGTKLIASEIALLRFRYFDGEGWVDEWNSDTEGGFPTAIEVQIVVDNGVDPDGEEPSQQDRISRGKLYRTVVYLPVAEGLSDEELALIEGAGR